MLAERHRARLAMQEGEVNARTETRRGQRVARRLFQDEDQDQDQDTNRSANELQGSVGAEDNFRNQSSELARQDDAKATMRWNFDFKNERPLPGRWVWRKVGPGGQSDENAEYDEEEDADREGIDQREKSETEASEKAEMTGGGKD